MKLGGLVLIALGTAIEAWVYLRHAKLGEVWRAILQALRRFWLSVLRQTLAILADFRFACRRALAKLRRRPLPIRIKTAGMMAASATVAGSATVTSPQMTQDEAIAALQMQVSEVTRNVNEEKRKRAEESAERDRREEQTRKRDSRLALIGLVMIGAGTILTTLGQAQQH